MRAMCTIVVLHDVLPEHPLAIVANRDEWHARASSAPRVLHEHPRAIGGVDLVSGGTWMGANALGLFVGLTNQRGAEAPDRTRRSRGDVVLRALALRDPSEVASFLRTIDARAYNAFNLIFGVPGDVRVAYARDDRAAIDIEPVAPGVIVLPNDRLGSPEFPKIARAEARTRDAMCASQIEPALLRVLADHDRPDDAAIPETTSRFPREVLRELQALCIHLPEYGTVSSTAILYGADRHIARYLFAPGPPCRVAFDDVTSLLVGAEPRSNLDSSAE
ncbi:Hypothetical protein DB32_001727 [Sandaracinus amylolyticus]|uniref:NRDE family protein n=2 Tax=Sandaracinus amylolyticus TaxID=927083 RepID=A0A0F6YGD5_9BACT|nr:Hypothetical protein DB32_001727 [Sandaracinus amylolyticus]